MAGKIARIQEVLNPENLAFQLTGLYSTWRIQRATKEADWRELRNYLFATDTTTTTNSQLPWKNKTTIPKLTQIRDNLHANYMDALFPNDDWLRWEGYSADDVVASKRRAIQAYMKNKLRESGFRETVSSLIQDYIDYGNAFGEVVWVEERHKDPLTEEMVDTYIGPKLIRVSPTDIIFNPTAISFDKSPKFTRYLKSLGELEIDIREGNLGYDKAVLDKIKKTRHTLTQFQMEDIDKASAYLVDGFGSLQEYYQSGLVEIIEFEGTIYDDIAGVNHENKIITIVDRTDILRNVDNPSWLGTDSKLHVGWRDRPDNLYSSGPLDNLVGMQYRVDHLENLKADALDMTIHPPIVIQGDVEPFTWQPEEVIRIPEDGSVSTLPPNAQAFQVNNEIAYLLGLMEEMAGAPKEAMGFRTQGEKTAFEVDKLDNAAQRIFRNKSNKFEVRFIEVALNKMLEVAKRNLNMTDIVRVMDDDLGVVEFLSITKEDITAKGKLRPIGSRHFAARAQLMQNMLGVFNSPVGQMIAPHVSAKKLAKLVEEQMGFEKYEFIQDNIAVIEQGETQRLVNQTQQAVQSEDAQPTEENLLNTPDEEEEPVQQSLDI